jgi:PHD/YefM family antitoxin component YafN of YafNO toxin-antitoxin module
MSTITYTEARENLASIWDKTVTSREPVVRVVEQSRLSCCLWRSGKG